MLSLKLSISGIKVVGFSHCLLKNSVVSVDSLVHFQTISLDYQEALAAVLGGGDAAERNF